MFQPINIDDLRRAEGLASDDRSEAWCSTGSGTASKPSLPPVDFSMIGGLNKEILSLLEMMKLPLQYPHICEAYNIQSPKGVLFYGPPGTGKTMTATALAYSCSSEANQKVAIFLAHTSELLNKYVGESERSIRMLFEQARRWQPSLIFFDEIDGLAPARTSKQDQVHASMVSTLLTMMDGLESRGQVVVVGATNRLDSIDPALRRPGRFDREFYFGLPNEEARRHII
ncbi:hypothetical protein CXG81DRAFT_10833, partial [Caulochytrium protostelioides]